VQTQLDRLAAIADELRRQATIEQQLQLLVERTAALLDAPRVAVRLLDPTRARLLAVARAGQPLHRAPFADFAVGEGLVGWIVSEGQPVLVGNAEADPRFVRRAEMSEPLVSFLGVPLLTRESCIGVLYGSHARRHYFQREHQLMLTLLAGMCTPHLEAARLEKLSTIDALTGALNRRGVQAILSRHDPISVVLCDLDHFKRINDGFGHTEGDHVLSRVAALLGSVVRAGDVVARWGGEEFLLVLPAVDLARAHQVAERARRAVACEPFTSELLQVTLSAGVAERRRAESVEQLIRRADEALYQAKRAGRNHIRDAR
jgi:diguanylate cyclase (GGDEF)-like protein